MAKVGAKALGGVSRSKSYHRSGAWAVKAKNGGKFPVHAKATKTEAPVAAIKGFYPADDVKTPLKRTSAKNPTKLRSSIAPGQVLILLAGRFKGARVVFLRQLPSGLLLITGPFGLNGVPLRRVNQAYVIATSTSVDVSAVDSSAVSDAFFKAEGKKKRSAKNEDGFFAEQAAPTALPAEVVEAQKAVDASILAALSPELKSYLKARFTLRTGDRPHLLKF